MHKVIISEDVLVTMVCAAAETYNKETYGYLLGRKVKTDYYLQFALPHQDSFRSCVGVKIFEDSEKRLINTINFLKGYKFIGEFHSHPNGPSSLSKADKDDMIDNGGGISVLVSIEKAKRYQPWKYSTKDRCISGTVEEEFLIKIKAYVKKEKRQIRKLRIQCDFIKKLNKRIKKDRPSFFE